MTRQPVGSTVEIWEGDLPIRGHVEALWLDLERRPKILVVEFVTGHIHEVYAVDAQIIDWNGFGCRLTEP